MSPEQVMSHPFDERSDIYSLGITVYEAVTGRRPFRSESEYEIMNAHLHELPVSPGILMPSLPIAVSAAILKSLAKAPADRYQSALEFQAAWRQAFFGGDDSTTMVLPQTAGPVAHKMDPQELARVESGLTRVLGPIAKSLVAKAATRHHTLDTLSRFLAGEIPGDEDRAVFLKSCGVASAHKTTPSGSQRPAPIDETTLAAARKALAASLGPIAAMVVSRTAKRVHSPEELRDALAAEIADEQDRKRFLAAFLGR
jgi:serine/threonine-protein kinase